MPGRALLLVVAGILGPATSAQAQYYRSYAEIGQILLDTETDYPDMCKRYDLGLSVDGRHIWALRISDNVTAEEDEPEFKYISTMHGNEIIGNEMCLYLIDYLVMNYGSLPRITNIVDSVELWIVPLMNPDGYVYGTRGNANGTDLNRNFPDPFTSPENTTDGRAPETAVIMNWSFGRSFTLAANLHGGSLVVNYPFDNNASGSSVYTPTPDDDMFIWISEEYSQQNLPMWNGGFYHGITNGADWYTISGGMQDWSYRYMGCNEVTVELGIDKDPPASQIPSYWNDNRESMLAYIETCLTGVRGIVTDGLTGEPLAATIRVVGRDHDIYTDPDVGDYHRMLETGTYDLTFETGGYDVLTITNVDVDQESAATRLDVEFWQTAVEYPNGGEILLATLDSEVTWTGDPSLQYHVQYTANYNDISSVFDGFESGTLDPAYSTGGDSSWAVTSSASYNGTYAARAGEITDGETTWMTRTVQGGDLSFWYLVSSEEGFDFFNFYVGGIRKVHASGTSGGWTYYSTTLPAGSNELRWEYYKDVYGISHGDDTVWIDDLEIAEDNTTWMDIVALTSPGVTSLPWTPTEASDDYKVRVRSYYGGDAYGTYDESDQTFTVLAVGDFDGDEDVDQSDFETFDYCFTGPGGGPIGPGCEAGDADADDDVDCDDWARFVLAWTEPGDPPEYAPCREAIPATSEWGLVVLALLVLTVGTMLLSDRLRGAVVAIGDGAARGASREGGPS